MKAISTIKKEVSRLNRRAEHMSERISKKKKKGQCYSFEYHELVSAIARRDALKWSIS